jgi:hypothetical protein
VGGTAVSPDGATLAVFHRAERVWTGQSYSGELFQHMTNTTPISHETVMLLDRLTGSVRAQWGAYRNRSRRPSAVLSSRLVRLETLGSDDDCALHRASGRDLFSMPHGLTIDSEGHLWLTVRSIHTHVPSVTFCRLSRSSVFRSCGFAHRDICTGLRPASGVQVHHGWRTVARPCVPALALTMGLWALALPGRSP